MTFDICARWKPTRHAPYDSNLFDFAFALFAHAELLTAQRKAILFDGQPGHLCFQNA